MAWTPRHAPNTGRQEGNNLKLECPVLPTHMVSTSVWARCPQGLLLLLAFFGDPQTLEPPSPHLPHAAISSPSHSAWVSPVLPSPRPPLSRLETSRRKHLTQDGHPQNRGGGEGPGKQPGQGNRGRRAAATPASWEPPALVGKAQALSSSQRTGTQQQGGTCPSLCRARAWHSGHSCSAGATTKLPQRRLPGGSDPKPVL